MKILNDFNLIVEIPVQWVEMDIFEHINNSYYFKYFEHARIKYFEKIGFLKMYNEKKIGGVILKNMCYYLTPLTYPDVIEVGARTNSLEDDVIHMEHFIKSDKDGLAAFGESEIIVYDFKEKKKIKIPEEIIFNINSFEKIKL
jgi:acyl-CoA thioester hydrolase